MTDYENYNHTSKFYDQQRQALGFEVVLGAFSRNGVPLSEQHIVDAGCGTGNYSAAFLQRKSVKHITAVDLNEGMLEQCRNKLQKHVASGEIDISQGSLTELTNVMKAGSIDGITCNQVLHHVPLEVTEGFVNSSFQALKSGGCLIINTTDIPQCADGWWWAELIPEAIKKQQQRFPPVDTLMSFMQKAGFTNIQTLKSSEVLQGEGYFNIKGPFSQDFRNCDSMWADVSEEELKSALAKLDGMIQSGEVEQWFKERENKRKLIGQTTFVYCYKP